MIAESNLSKVEESILSRLEPYLLDTKGKVYLRLALLSAWRVGFKLGREEGLLDQHMYGGES